MSFKKIIYYSTGFLFLFAISCFGKPAIQFEKLVHDFGKVKQESELKYIFTFSNVGTSTLLIEKITAGWGCTGVLLSKKDIPAGGEGKIEVILKTGSNKEKISKNIYVYTNDENNKMVTLKVEATVTSKKDWTIF